MFRNTDDARRWNAFFVDAIPARVLAPSFGCAEVHTKRLLACGLPGSA